MLAPGSGHSHRVRAWESYSYILMSVFDDGFYSITHKKGHFNQSGDFSHKQCEWEKTNEYLH